MIYTLITIWVLAFTSLLVVFPPLEPIIWPFLGVYREFWWFVIPSVVAVEVIAAHVGYKISDTIGAKITNRLYKNKKKEINEGRLQKWGNVGVGVFAATPLPITFAVYYAGAKRFNIKGYLFAFAIGRFIKYFSYLTSFQLLKIEPEDIINWLKFWT